MHSSVRAWAQLVRIPNTLTACADVFAGFAIAAGAWIQESDTNWRLAAPSLGVAALSSIAMYWAGMALNDVHDVEADKLQRRNGPLVTGRISVSSAQTVGWFLLILGVAFALIASLWAPSSADANYSSALPVLVSALLAISIVAYDSRIKGTHLGPVLMGVCRALNLLMGVMLGACIRWPDAGSWTAIGVLTFGHFAYVAGITMAARREGFLQQSKSKLSLAWSTSILGLVAIASCSMFHRGGPLRLDPMMWFPFLIALLMFPWLRRVVVSIQSPGIGTLVPAIKQAILSIIFLDAAIALQFGNNIAGILVCSLAIPTVILSRSFRMT